jgi:hypothetical protein
MATKKQPLPEQSIPVKPIEHHSAIRDQVDSILNRMDFSEEDIVRATVENVRILKDAIPLRIDCIRAASAAEMNLERQTAELSLSIRNEARLNGEKMTEGLIEAYILTNDNITDLKKKLGSAKAWDMYSKLLIDACSMRRDCLQIIERMMAREMGMSRSVEEGRAMMNAARAGLKKKYPGESS